MKIAAVSDLHGHLPDIPECDLLLIAGDICPDFITETHHPAHVEVSKGEPQQAKWLGEHFEPWLDAIPARHIVGVAGNHDFVFQTPHLVPKLPWVYLEDSGVSIDGYYIWGTPWIGHLSYWGFYHPETSPWPVAIPPCDILLAHSPPYGVGDDMWANVPGKNVEHLGSKPLGDALAIARPKLMVCGHIHASFGHHAYEHVPGGIYNVANLNHQYVPHNPVVVLTLDDATVVDAHIAETPHSGISRPIDS
jgi:Icc-related predicted phosphoesterase